ncbi:unnamed protein product [Linum trigynum]|uniref:Retrotransposon gag domain-containing protein n=1 Tax=Linum trigynum TaxID=586398 RepID=A0AAV2G8F7_9ROSI
MSGYDTDGPPMGNGPGPLGHYTKVHNGLGWLDLEDGPEYDKLSLADQQAQWAEPELDLRGLGGPRRAGDKMGKGGSAPRVRTALDWARAGRAETSRAGIGRTDEDQTELSRTGPGRTRMGRPEVGRTGHRSSPTSQPIRRVDSRGPAGWEGPYEAPPAPGGYPNQQGSYPGDYGHGNPSQMQCVPFGQPWRTPGNDRYGSHYMNYEGMDGVVFRAKPPTIEFPKFNGQKDAGLWLYAVERWFKNHPIPEERKAYLASFYLEGDALQWWEWRERSYAAATTLITWHMFQEELRYQFGKSDGWAPQQLAKLKQTGTVAEYRAEFFKLGN